MDPAGFDMSLIPWLGLGLAALSNIAIGFLWYSPKTPTGRVWMRGAGIPMDHKPDPKKMVVSMLMMVVGTFLLMFVFAHNFVVYEDAFSNTETGGVEGYDLKLMDGFFGGLFTWLGFFLPVTMGAVMWEDKPWSYALNNAAYYLVSLVVAGLILAWQMG